MATNILGPDGLPLRINDGLQSALAGLGTERDKAASVTYSESTLDFLQLVTAYRTAWLPRKIVDIPAFDSCRDWRSWQADGEQIEDIEKEEKRLNLQVNTLSALKKARLFGGSAIYFDVGQAPETPLDISRLGKGCIRYITVLSARQLQSGDIETDPLSPNYNRPQWYTLQGLSNGRMVQIHPSRLAIFYGNEMPDLDITSGAVFAWGDSVLVSVMDAIKQADGTSANIASLIFEANVDVISITGLMAYVGTVEGEKRIMDRFRIAAAAKAINRMLILDGEEKYDRKSASFQNLPDLMDRFFINVAGAADIPVTRLFGQSPAGMNATGEGDLRNYYDRIKAGQTLTIDPAMAVLNDVVRISAGITDDNAYVEWNPLWQLSEMDKADIFVKKTTAARQIVGKNTGDEILPINVVSKALTNELVEDGTLSGLEDAVDEYGTLEENEPTDAELAAAQATAAAANQNAPQGQIKAKDALPRTLYVRRDVLNRAEITKWATDQGFTDVVPDLHVTICYSRSPVDWFKVGTSYSPKMEIAPGGPRQMEALGTDGKYAALLITANELVWRNREIMEAGAFSDFPEYQPHISIQVGGNQPDISKVAAYQGKIVLGPEIFEECKP